MSTERTVTRDEVVAWTPPPDVEMYGVKACQFNSDWFIHTWTTREKRDQRLAEYVKSGYVCIPITIPGATGATS